ncbi:28S ribosomal protein S5, mitochondrial [Amphibalanus amphitrite]|uniref:Small ribosomal subunit protein uS5m n=1 Tax=Amphibalanus amphitrite TaxID=1232801 RepID=A0A6A4WSR3_AMPAM|nr:28S ribosomal protein S5, mitochondrial [Amphibalanus amphitrite]
MLSLKLWVPKLAGASTCFRPGSSCLLSSLKVQQCHHAAGRLTPVLSVLVQKQDKAVLGIQPSRNAGFFTNMSANELWKGVTGVSNAGRKRGRGRGAGVKRRRDLNRGQVIGVGKVNMMWPGLNAPVLRNGELVRQQSQPRDEQRESRLQAIRDQFTDQRSFKLTPLERGWSGNRLPGRSIGPPDAVDFETFEGFDTTVLELKTVFSMTATAGRTRHISCFAVTGNGAGLVGYGLGKGNTGMAAIKQCKRRAGQRLIYVERCDGHTVFHDFFTRFAAVRIFVERRPRGHGLQCHRAIREICHRVGISDLYAKVEGPTDNVQSITKAFFLGLLRQRTHQQLADEKRLHLVELRPEADNYPRLVASPGGAPVRSKEQIPADEELDFQLHIFEGKVPLKMPPKQPFYMKLPCYQTHLNKVKHLKNQEQVRVSLLAEHGEVRSFLADQYPECRAASAALWAEKRQAAEDDQEQDEM